MTSHADWLSNAFFEDPEQDSLDGGTTNQGPLWHAISPRWGHAMHSMCSYQGMFPARLAHYFIQRYSKPGDLVADPFSGRGTVALQARVERRRALSNDLNPLAYVLTAAKSDPPPWGEITKFVSQLERSYPKRAHQEVDVSEDIRMLFHEDTLRQICFLRDHLQSKPMLKWTREELMLAGTMAGILHGAHRSDGSSMYLSISMPNTFSMPPTYVRKYIYENKLHKIDQNVFERLRDKLARIYLDSTDGPPGRTYKRDAPRFLTTSAVRPGSIDLIVTSPPYLQVVNYGTSNWIRLWWLGIDEVSRHGGAGRRSLDSELDHRHLYDSYRAFLLRTLRGVQRVLQPSGVAVVVIGDVTTAKGPSYELAHHVWSDVGAETNMRLLDVIEDSLPSQTKVSRIWGDTKGRATDQDRVLVLARTGGDPTTNSVAVQWDEPYKDGGPDEAHRRFHRQRLAS